MWCGALIITGEDRIFVAIRLLNEIRLVLSKKRYSTTSVDSVTAPVIAQVGK